MEKTLKLSDFRFDLPESMIAQTPAGVRSDAKLLWREKDGSISHKHVRDLPNLLPSPCLFVVNNSKVFPARVFGESPTGAHIEFLLLSLDKEENVWDAMVRPKRRIKPNLEIRFATGVIGKIVSTEGDLAQSCKIQFNKSEAELYAWLDQYGQMPLPPYIHRDVVDGQQAQGDLDQSRYQTVFAQDRGSVAAPTASLHFDDRVLPALKAMGCDFAEVTLHVGAGTFLPVSSEDIDEHQMHFEYFNVPKSTVDKIYAAKEKRMPVIGVGTTTLRTLEALDKNKIGSWQRTNLFVRPKKDGEIYKPWCLDALMTNFHQPNSTLFMLISALIGREEALGMYDIAMQNKYRFLSYGDSSLLWL